MRTRFLLSAALGLLAASAAFAQGTDWYTPTRENKPFVRWWWLGSAVDREGLTYNLEEFAKAGIGGYEVTPIYGVQGNEANDIDYLSPKWMEMYKFLVAESARLDLQCDLNNGTGWPFGGPQITPELAAQKMEVGPDGVKSVQTGQKVKRAAPGGEGFVMDHYNPEALKVYLDRFDKAFAQSGASWPHTWFNDSYEVYGANWTPKYAGIFRERYGYDIEPYLQNPKAGDDSYDRAIADYRECLGTLLVENFIDPWIAWCHGHGSLVRNQSHGSPANLLDVYAAVDIPECETFGRSPFDIPGLRQDPIGRPNDGDPAVLKLASSAAHVAGKKYTSSETLTWMTEHFRTSLSQCKPEIDQMFASGVNHVYFHGAPYSPKGAEFPGWLFYASINMSPTGSLWKDAPELVKYIERCQAFLTAGSPDSDFYLYFPVYDLWSSRTETAYMMFDIHSMGRTMPDVKAAMNGIVAAGFDADYISDKQLCEREITKPVIVPAVKLMPVETVRRLAELKKQGVPVYFIGNVPKDVPGLHDLAARRKAFKQAAKGLGKPTTIEKVFAAYKPETFKSELGGQMIRRRNECGGWNYFAAMLRNQPVDGWVKLATPAAAAMLYDAVSGTSGQAQVRTAADGCAEIRLQLQPGESILIKTFPEAVQAPAWPYVAACGEPVAIDRAWNISFPESAPEIKGNFFTDKPQDWTKLKVDAAKVNFGTALYSSAIDLLHPEEADEWVLDLGDVRESARVYINGEYAGTAWSVPFRLPVGKFLKPGINLLEVYVTNLPSNRIADYDRRGVKWRIFKDANVNTIGPKTFEGWATDPSGLCSEVNLIPVHYDVPSSETVLAQARRVNDYFMQKFPDPLRVVPFPSRHKVYEGNIWTRGVYYEGLMALYGV
ncbi:MAG: glycosyl hydrolase family 2, partial [Bacteroidales bacterium]|nr:glycosyl hydrolase family 2 [Bacteroidales bacterium]